MKRLLWTLLAILVPVSASAQCLRQQSTSTYHFVFLMIDSSDHISGKTGLSPTVTISKNAASFGSPSGAITEIGSGWYKLAGNSTDSNTLGSLLVHATDAAADPTDIQCEVVAFDPFDSVRAGLTALPNAAAAASNGLLTSGTGSNQITTSSGQVTTATNNDKTGYSLSQSFPSNFSSLSIDSNGRAKAQVNYIKNVAIANFTFTITDNSNHLALTGKVNGDFTKKYRTDSGSVTSLGGTITEVDSTNLPGVYQINLSATEMNGTVVTLRFKTSDSDETIITLVSSQ